MQVTESIAIMFQLITELAAFINPVVSLVIGHQLHTSLLQSTVVQIFALMTAYEDDLVEEFDEQLKSTIKEIPRKDLIIIPGDWNATVGPDT